MEVSMGRNTVPSNKELVNGTLSARLHPLTPYWREPFSIVGCLAIPLGAGILSWVLACRIIENPPKVSFFLLRFLSSNIPNPVICLPDIQLATAP